MNVVLHALAGGAVAHAAARLVSARGRPPSFVALASAAFAGIASHGVLDWLRHGYPIPSALDVLLALGISAGWLLLVRAPLRVLFASALAGAFLPDVVDHLPGLLHLNAPWPTPLFPWHSPQWSGSLYPAARIRAGSHLVPLEEGNNQLASLFNHVLVIAASLACVASGRAAFSSSNSRNHARNRG